jgi:hypothetical protein
MSELARRQAGRAPFWLAVFIWLLATFPCVHLEQLYTRHHLFGSIGAHPELFTAYLRRAIWATTALSVLGPALLWLIPARFKKEPEAVIFWGGAIGVVAATALWAIMAPAFGWVSDKPLKVGTFLYSGLLAGIVAGEVNRRALSAQAGMVPTASKLKRDFQVASLMIWAVVLKAVECVYLLNAQPGRGAVGLHFAMFLSTLLWSPWACRFFWKHRPESLLSSVIRNSAAGVLFPPLSAAALYVPAIMLLFGGFPSAYAMLWGGTVFLDFHPSWLRVVAVFPGLIWGVLVGLLRWRYLRLEEQISLPLAPQ